MKYVGDFAKADMNAMRLAQELQAQAMSYIQDAFFAEEELNANNLTPARFMREYEKARDDEGLMNELNRQLAAIIGPIIPLVFAPPEQGQQ